MTDSVTTYALIKQAILDRKQVAFTYHGRRRRASPHLLGWKDRRPRALVYQFAGGSRSGLSREAAENWRCVFIDELEDAEVQEGHWHTAAHEEQQSCVDVVDVFATDDEGRPLIRL